MLVAAVTSRKARDRFAHTDDLKDALRPSQAAWWPPIHDGMHDGRTPLSAMHRVRPSAIRPVRKL